MSIPGQCCALPYTLNGEVYHNCTVNMAETNDLGCYHHTNGPQWVTCQQPDGLFRRSTDVSPTDVTPTMSDVSPTHIIA